MGGNALEANTARASSRHYLNVFAQVQRRLQSEWPEVATYLPRKHRQKENHGDLDLLVRRDTANLSRKWINSTFDNRDLYVNDGVWTFDMPLPTSAFDNRFQVDLVTKRPEHWEMSKAYLDQSGFGNICGKLARWLRYKLGFQGLRMPVYKDPEGERSVKYGEYVLTRDPQRAFEFLELDYEGFQEGFSSMKEIFDYIAKSKYFCEQPFLPENMNAGQRHRDRKRPVWSQFKEYLSGLKQNGNLPSKPKSRPTQEEAIQKAKEAFLESEIHHRLEGDKETFRLREKARETWTGEVPMNEFGIEGEKLGEMLQAFQNTFNSDRHRFEWVVRNSLEEALERFKWANRDHFDEVDQSLAQGDEYSRQSLLQNQNLREGNS